MASTTNQPPPPSSSPSPNRLFLSKSPYLLQHKDDPVHWHSWSQEAITKAKQQDKPIFLSIGYSTCHWCHVMHRESFISPEIADILNQNFISIKVDREERPDVDRIYMTYVQATSGGGGWPMSVFLTPNLEPFLGGTYFPPTDNYGRPGFKTLLLRVADAWREKKEEIKVQSADTVRQMQEFTSNASSSPISSIPGGTSGADQLKCIETAVEQIISGFDPTRGGFGTSPKFPRPSEINIILRQYLLLLNRPQKQQNAAVDADELLHKALFSLQKMASGGIYDHLGGGFHRYSVDELWHVPHFEKMTYDNPQLVLTYLAAFQITKDTQYAAVARSVLDYLLRDMRHPDGGIFAAEDADSTDPMDLNGPKKEGAFYVWTREEIDEVLSSIDVDNNGRNSGSSSPTAAAELFKERYLVKEHGNCNLSPRSDPHGEFTGQNVLISSFKSLDQLSSTYSSPDKSPGQIEEILAKCRELLFNRRAQRPRPHRDEKIITAWNGMAIAALATASRVLMTEDPPVEANFPITGCSPVVYLDAAQKVAKFIRTNMYDEKEGILQRSWNNGPADIAGFADDYAWMVSGLLELYFAGGDVDHLDWARKLQQKMDELFWDSGSGGGGGGYFQNQEGDDSVILRMKDDYDGAEPTANSIAMENLWRLAGFEGVGCERQKELLDRAQRCAAAFQDRLTKAPIALPQMCCSLHLLALGLPKQVVLVSSSGGVQDSRSYERLLDAVYAPYAPDKVVIHVDTGDERVMEWWRGVNPEVVELVSGGGDRRKKVLVCQNFTCQAPSYSVEEVAAKVGVAQKPVGGVVVGKVELPWGKGK
jgi:uncharacterized protein YyaL (SSP411 family)